MTVVKALVPNNFHFYKDFFFFFKDLGKQLYSPKSIGWI